MRRKAPRILLMWACALTAATGWAQDSDPSQSPPPAVEPAPAAPSLIRSEVNVTIERIGVGNQLRRGEWAGFRVGIIDSTDRPRDLIVQLEVSDADGDSPIYQQKITANPGVNQSVWLYARVPFNFDESNERDLVVSVRLAVESGDSGEPGAPGARPGRLVGREKIRPRKAAILSAQIGMIGVFGQRALGLGAYAARAGAGEVFHERVNEVTERITGLSADEIPDRWLGLVPYQSLIWAEGDPSRLRGERATAVRDWVLRGGHLVVILPPVGQTFTNPASNELHDIMPAVLVTTRERVEFEPYRPLLTLSDSKLFPRTSTVQSFKPRPDTILSEAARILNGPDNECVVVRRLVGAGAVTMIGLDLNQTALSQGDLIDPEVFWHRVLGRRGQVIDYTRNSANPSGGQTFAGSNQHFLIDGDVSNHIAMSGKSAAGVLAGLIVFAVYWGIAGPFGFAVLRKRGQSHHSWLFFVASAAAFTALAWGGTTILRPKRVEATHFTLLDHVFGQSFQRARMWASVLIPSYGESTLAIGKVDSGGASRRGSFSAVASWDPPETAGGANFGGFPDARGYPVDARDPSAITVPTRSTVKQIQADWAGGPVWEMPIPVSSDGDAGRGRITLRAQTWEALQTPLVTGSLAHQLPGPLRDVVVMVVVRQQPLAAARPRPQANTPANLLFEAYAFEVTGEWTPGTPLVLDDVAKPLTTLAERARFRAATFFERLVPKSGTGFGAMRDPTQLRSPSDMVSTLAFFPLLPQPDRANAGLNHYIPLRAATHGWDLGMWFTQPCLIIVGRLGGGRDGLPTPVPLTVDGEPVPTSGQTIVRWVYPLPDDPPAFPSDGSGPASPEGNPSDAEPRPR
ncbi:MAG: hypothetical protein JNK25_05935 [Phycisphaerae bacterium]|nr:hypothetical protein [Phycisphaerae bacterium]